MPSFRRSTSTSSSRSTWSRIVNLFNKSNRGNTSSCRSSAIYSIQTESEDTQPTSTSGSQCSLQCQSFQLKRRSSLYKHAPSVSPAVSIPSIPPFSPTYCQTNEFPYSNFYVRLPNGKWMVRYRSGTRSILGTEELEGYMI